MSSLDKTLITRCQKLIAAYRRQADRLEALLSDYTKTPATKVTKTGKATPRPTRRSKKDLRSNGRITVGQRRQLMNIWHKHHHDPAALRKAGQELAEQDGLDLNKQVLRFFRRLGKMTVAQRRALSKATS